MQGVALSVAKGVDISDQNEALRRENADLYSQIKALSQRIAQGSAGEIDSHHTCDTVGAFGQGRGLSLTAWRTSGASSICSCNCDLTTFSCARNSFCALIVLFAALLDLVARFDCSMDTALVVCGLLCRAGLSVGAGSRVTHSRGSHVCHD